jgi:alpha-tubulin suppressor-like RCC1 family protein
VSPALSRFFFCTPMNLNYTTPLVYRSIFISQDNQVWSWGRNLTSSCDLLHLRPQEDWEALTKDEKEKYRQLAPMPIPPSRLPCASQEIQQVALGYDYVLLLTKNGKVYGWGDNGQGQLGFPPETTPVCFRPELVEIPGDPKIESMCCGDYTSFLVSEDGDVYSFGAMCSSLGREESPESPPHVPTKIAGVSEIVKISAVYHMLALTKNGEVFGWGDNWNGHLGLGQEEQYEQYLPTKIPFDVEISDICAGGNYSMFITKTGNLFACGANSRGQLGLGDDESDVRSPVLVPLEGVVSVACGWEHSLVLTRDGTLYSFGNNQQFRLGIKVPEAGLKKKVQVNTLLRKKTSPTPVDFKFPEPIVWLAGGMEESMAITKNGNLYTWGERGNIGQGEGDYLAVTRPKLVRGIKFKLPFVVTEKKWETIFYWVALGRGDLGSDFSIFPVEVHFNFVDVVFNCD